MTFKSLSNLLASNGSHIFGFAEELLLPAPALLDRQQGNSQRCQHLAGLTHVVTGEVDRGWCFTLFSPFDVTVATLTHS